MRNSKGQALVEYILIITLVAVIALVVIKILGGYITDAVTKSSCDLVNKVYKEGEKPGEGKCVNGIDNN